MDNGDIKHIQFFLYMIPTTQMYGDYRTPLVNNKVDLLIKIATEKGRKY